MARPQREDGYTGIANEILDNICRYNFNGSQFRIITKVWRMTYGFLRKDHDFSVSYLHEATGLSEVTIKKELAFLVKSRVLIVTQSATNIKSRRFSFNKNYEDWEVPAMAKKPSLEVKDSLPQNDDSSNLEVYDSLPLEVYDPLPQNVTLGYTILTPRKKEDLKENLLKENALSFDDFYAVYPRKVSKEPAKKAWNKLAKEKGFDPAWIIECTANYAATCKQIGTATNYILHPSTFLNQKRYEDYPTIDPEGIGKGKNGAQMDLIANFYLEGEDDEQARNGEVNGRHQDRLPEFRGD